MRIKTLLSVFVFIFFGLGLFSLFIPNILAQEDSLEDLQEKIEKYEEKLANIRSEKKTLAGEIENLDAQLGLISTRIQASVKKISQEEREIQSLSTGIEDLKARIEKLVLSMEHQKKVLLTRARENYKNWEASPMVVFLGASTFRDLVNKYHYIEIMEKQDNKLIKEMEVTKEAFNKQKGLLEEQKKKEETLKEQLLAEKASLDSYKYELEGKKINKQKLLEVTANSEAKYQKLLADAQKELNQITGAVAVLKNQNGSKVKKGDLIGIQGSSGYSFGDHLHFGVYKYSSFDDIDGWDWYYSNHIDPQKKLKSKNIYWNDGCSSATYKTIGSGDWRWPMDSPTVSQGYGNTCWSSIYYGGKAHPAYDMYGSYGAGVYAVDDGTAYYCRNCLGDGGNGVFIFHDDGYMTLYWHLR